MATVVETKVRGSLVGEDTSMALGFPVPEVGVEDSTGKVSLGFLSRLGPQGRGTSHDHFRARPL